MKRVNHPGITSLDLRVPRRCAAVALAFLSLAGCATKELQPNQQSGVGRSGFDAADVNHDGKLSRDEAATFLVNQIFDSRDANHDGKLTAKEWADDDPGRLADFKKRDANHDGIVTKEEAIAYARKHGLVNKMFEEADKNHDGYLDRAEVQAYYASREGPPN